MASKSKSSNNNNSGFGPAAIAACAIGGLAVVGGIAALAASRRKKKSTPTGAVTPAAPVKERVETKVFDGGQCLRATCDVCAHTVLRQMTDSRARSRVG